MKALLAFCLLLSLALTANAQNDSFKILSFTIDNREVKEYSVTFEVEGKELVPMRQGNKILVPKEIAENDQVAIRFQARGYDFKFSPPAGFNSTGERDVEVDYIVGVDTPPFQKENLFKRDARKFQVIYFLQTVPSVPLNSHIIIDPIRFTVGDLRRKGKG